MYLPEHFREERPEVLRDLMEKHPLAALITVGPAGIEANHIPLLYTSGKLMGHFARANKQWRDADGAEALVIFQGPQAYISPNWYPSKEEHGRAVPTWNYAAVHVRGKLTVYDDPARLRRFLDELTARHESTQPQPWSVADAPPDYVNGLLNAIVGIELTIRSVEGKWKVSQNQPHANMQGAAEGLEEMAHLMRRARPSAS